MAKRPAAKAESEEERNDRLRIELTEHARVQACNRGIVIDRSGHQLDAAGRIVGERAVVPVLEGCR